MVVGELVEGAYTLNGVLPPEFEAFGVYGSFLRHIFVFRGGCDYRRVV